MSQILTPNPDGLKLDNVHGGLTLEGVKVSYPSQPSLQAVKGLDITFRVGKTAALVGSLASQMPFFSYLCPAVF